MTSARTENSRIASILRKRICLAEPATDDLTLHEGAIAEEFGVSRTPIRQVLQRLAYERLVETRTGVGTVVSPLEGERRLSDATTLMALLNAACECARGKPSSRDTMDRLTAVLVQSESAKRDAEGYLGIRTDVLDLASDAAPDKILGDALRAAHWRQIRWHMADQVWTDSQVFDGLISTIRACRDAARNDGLAGLFARLSQSAL